jgi:hypothetical protein
VIVEFIVDNFFPGINRHIAAGKLRKERETAAWWEAHFLAEDEAFLQDPEGVTRKENTEVRNLILGADRDATIEDYPQVMRQLLKVSRTRRAERIAARADAVA